MKHPLNLYSAQAVKALDAAAIEQQQIRGLTLMERAAQATFQAVCSNFPVVTQAQAHWVLVCGLGNNAGDAYVIARLAHVAGYAVRVLQLGDVQKLRGDARAAYQALCALGVTVQAFSPALLTPATVIVDGIFGIGLDRLVSDEWAAAIEAINQHPAPVVAVDIPSGLHPDTGCVLGVAIKAQLTVSFIGLKQGMFTAEGVEYCGKIHFDDLQVPAQIYAQVLPSARRLDADNRLRLPPRPRQAHKGDFGHLLLIGGDLGMSGAILLAGQAAARAGCGKVTIATHPEHAAWLTLTQPELMCRGVYTPEDLQPLLQHASVIAIGPGLGQSDWAWMLFNAVIQQHKPLVLDADALNLLAKAPIKPMQAVLTPHPAEAARLLQCHTAQIQADRFAAVRQIQQKFGGVCVLKGAGTLIANAQDGISLCSAGNPGMASGGMGDLLTGLIGSLAAQISDLHTAALMGVCLHAAAGDLAAQEGERGLLASDLLPWIRHLLNT